ncbi:MAG TPA: ArsI/CadI family heavy metal resistance metalloenzyme [Pyrinomonadaceae bacterium]|jgi:catechol 2,3-dioxygenase-like lactoylglutathione lyase family enzyme|nr:ArsI/CadI family heavy metal resistance metalloenzyme [Pyrinomonadaceae bacterium]
MESKTTKGVSALKAHLALNVKSVERSIEFYKKMLGLEPSKARPGYAKFDVENPPLNLTLNENSFGERGALSHLGIQVATSEDVLAMRERWAEAGLYTRDEMQTNCCYALQDKTWVSDPDGNEWEAFVVLEDNLSETSACCVSGAATETDATVAETTATVSANSPAAASSCCGGSTAPLKISR